MRQKADEKKKQMGGWEGERKRERKWSGEVGGFYLLTNYNSANNASIMASLKSTFVLLHLREVPLPHSLTVCF